MLFAIRKGNSMRICVYMGSRDGSKPAYLEQSKALGKAMASRGHGLVYGGGNTGLMGAVADEMLGAGIDTFGVIPAALAELEVAHQGLTELVITNDMHQRKKAMLDRADAFIALPGGLGTFEELFEALTWQQLGFHSKPVGLLNVDGYYDGLITFLEASVEAGFVSKHHHDSLIVSDNVEDILDQIETAEVVYVPKNTIPAKK